MAAVGATYVTLVDLARRTMPDGVAATIIEMLNQVNPILDHAPVIPCNQGLTHLTTVRTGLPTATWTKLYQGIPASKSTTRQVEDTTGMLEALSTIDMRLLGIAKDAAQVRLQEAAAHLEGMSQTHASTIFYGDTGANPERFMGLAPRFNALTGAENSSQVISAGGSGSDNASIWMITWGADTCHLLVPDRPNISAGITRTDKGEQRVLDGDGNAYYVKEEHFGLHGGLSVRDWRYVTRICNIDVSLAQTGKASLDLLSFMRSAFHQHHSIRKVGGKTCMYMNRDVMEAFELQLDEAALDREVAESDGSAAYRASMMYRGVPVYVTDALLSTEAVVS